MRSLLLLLFLAVALPASAQRLLLKNLTVLDPDAQASSVKSLVIDEGHIVAVLETVPAAFEGEVLDLTGKFLLPGLFDLHTHSFGNLAPTRRPQLLGPHNTAKLYLYAGVTGFLDLFSMEDVILGLRSHPEWPGATLYAAGPILTAPGGHGTEYGVPTRTMANPEEARKHVSELAAKKPDVVKIVYHPHDQRPGGYPSMDRLTMEAIVAEAHAHELKVVAHINTWDDARDVVGAGVDAITHTGRGPIPGDVVALMRDKKAAIIPTLTVQTDLVQFVTNPDLLDNPMLQAMAHPLLLQAYRDTSAYPDSAKRWVRRQSVERKEYLASIRVLAEAGVPVLTGTDAGNPGVFQGYSVHREIALLVEAGLATWDALQAATTAPAAFLGVAHGVRQGAPANLLVLDASPLEDITNTQRIYAVVHRGKIVDRISLLPKYE